MRQHDRLAKEDQEGLKDTLTKLTAEWDQLLSEKANAAAREESLNAELEKCQGFMLQVSEESFNQGVRQVAYYHDVPSDDPQYDLCMDAVDGKLMPLGGGPTMLWKRSRNALK